MYGGGVDPNSESVRSCTFIRRMATSIHSRLGFDLSGDLVSLCVPYASVRLYVGCSMLRYQRHCSLDGLAFRQNQLIVKLVWGAIVANICRGPSQMHNVLATDCRISSYSSVIHRMCGLHLS
jgi:hypothetical protein